ncbi:hypothetical protein NA57DRAFT_76578 [Rhizodiscina lignyota]|uniref:Uncharacterized protein n=1 Tax=Rhizodiscina lignyota TaxID=1504668 RepID=A0A9P4IEH0_9PEZI|nr:hypothetical protein NA57DRAFT_76578 [Rhizodiscina lignyota]
MFRPKPRSDSVTSPSTATIEPPAFTLQPFPKPSSPGSIPSAEASRSRLPLPEERPPAYEVERLPDYTPLDENILSYNLSAPLISAGTSIRYQLKLNRGTRTDRPTQICIRRLMPSESRRLSRTSSIGSTKSIASSVGEYDDSATMYTITKLAIFWGGEAPFEIKGHRASTLPGNIRLERSERLGSRRWYFHHHKRNPANDMLKPENAKRMQKYGYHPDDEWCKTLLFTASGNKDKARLQVDWKNGQDQPIAVETDQTLTLYDLLEPKLRDLLVTCWMARAWHAATLRWEEESL